MISHATYLLLYLDESVLMTFDFELLRFGTKFYMTDLWQLNYFLSIVFTWDNYSAKLDDSYPQITTCFCIKRSINWKFLEDPTCLNTSLLSLLSIPVQNSTILAHGIMIYLYNIVLLCTPVSQIYLIGYCLFG